MKIGMILDKKFPPDIRVENEAVSLTEHGFEVNLLCVDYESTSSSEDRYQGFNLIRIGKSKKWIYRGRALINTPLNYYTYFWAEKIRNFIHSKKIDVLHVHDLYLLGAAYRANRQAKIPIIADLHENYVDGLKNYRFANTFPGNIIISKSKWARKEVEWCKKADRIITVIEEAVERYRGLGVPKDKLVVVANYVNEDQFLDAGDDPEILKRFKNNFAATYIGGFDTHRGLESVINAVPRLIKKIPNFKLVLVGHGRNYDELIQLAKDHNIYEYVSFEGFQAPDKLPSYIKASTVCLIPHLKSVHTDNTIPHKLFHYMLLAKPILSSNCNPIVRILASSGTGITYESGNHQDLANKMIDLAADEKKLKQLGGNGPKAVKTIYNWSGTAKNLISLYENIEGQIMKAE